LAYKFNFDLAPLSKSLFKEIARICDESNVHKKIVEASLRLVKTLRIQEATGLPLSDALTLVEDLVDNYVENLSQRRNFQKTKRRALLLPHCSRKHMDNRCQAHFDAQIPSYLCARCSTDCLIRQAVEAGERKGYDVYILPGGSCVHKILSKSDYKGIVGVACCEEIELARDLLKNLDIVSQAVPLVKNGCSNTQFNLETLETIL
jgi:hypothetical protein